MGELTRAEVERLMLENHKIGDIMAILVQNRVIIDQLLAKYSEFHADNVYKIGELKYRGLV